MHTTHPLCSKPPFSYGAHGFLKHVKTRECLAVYSSQSWAKHQIRRPGPWASRPGPAGPDPSNFRPGPAWPTSEIQKPLARPGSWAGGGDQILRDGLRWMLKKGLLGRNFSGRPKPARRPMGRWVGPGHPKEVGPARPRADGPAGAGPSNSDSSPLRCLFSPHVPR